MKTDFKEIRHNHVVIPVAGAGEGWIIVDKPAGMSVHNNPGQD